MIKYVIFRFLLKYELEFIFNEILVYYIDEKDLKYIFCNFSAS